LRIIVLWLIGALNAPFRCFEMNMGWLSDRTFLPLAGGRCTTPEKTDVNTLG